jgi:hypothetical protein
VNDELERMWKEAFVAYFNALSRNLREGSEEKHDFLVIPQAVLRSQALIDKTHADK